ncbi:hypothetical protein CEXT_296191 [Caerostris extrusa]|uniref:Uncharacterized protein n=1 Tax=Caerostris extrusa TaxID=172846 RepID=A0AAV4X259_CAEEX|nr:hypothetical protein CEXT_296191 [Caerostris extrusa]
MEILLALGHACSRRRREHVETAPVFCEDRKCRGIGNSRLAGSSCSEREAACSGTYANLIIVLFRIESELSDSLFDIHINGGFYFTSTSDFTHSLRVSQSLLLNQFYNHHCPINVIILIAQSML